MNTDTYIKPRNKHDATSRRRYSAADLLRRLIETSETYVWVPERLMMRCIYVSEAMAVLDRLGYHLGEHPSRELGNIIRDTGIKRNKFHGTNNKWVLYLEPSEG